MWAAATRLRNTPLNMFALRWFIQGPVNIACLQECLAALIERHHTLRANLVLQGGQLFQVVRPSVAAPLQLLEVSADDADARLALALAHIRRETAAQVNLATEALARFMMATLEPQRHILALVVHHAMCDGWSGQILIAELAKMYAAGQAGRQAELPGISEQFDQFAAEQLALGESGGYQEELHYWEVQLRDLPEPPQLPLIQPRRGARNMSCSYPSRIEGVSLLANLRASARALRVTPFVVLASTLAVLIHERTGVNDLLLGVSTLNRWRSSHLCFVGSATNLLPLRVRLLSGLRFDQLCLNVHQTMRELLAHSRVPLEVIARSLGHHTPSPDHARLLNMPIWCQYREAVPQQALELTAIAFDPLPIERQTLSCDLEVDWMGGPNGLRCEYAYRSELFGSATIDGWMQAGSHLIQQVSMNHDLEITELTRRLRSPTS